MDAEMRRSLQAALAKMREELAKKPDEEIPTFEVKPIHNGYLVEYNDVEEYTVKVPIYPPPGGVHGVGTPCGPTYESQHRWKIVRVSVFCADADAIKHRVDESLRLEEKVKLLIAEGVLSSNDASVFDTAVGA